MNQVFDLLGSYLIGGIVLAALVALILHFTSKSQETTLSQITQYTVVETGMVMENDFDLIGYRVASGPKIMALSADSICFRADLNNTGTIDTVKFYAGNTNGTLRLFKKIGTVTKWSMPVKSFSIQGIDSAGSQTYNIANIKSFIVSIVTHENSIDDPQNNIGAFWKGRIYPKNL
jgi:hypothetical protein